MTQDEIAQAMQDSAGNSWGNEAHFQRFAALIVNAEREACAKVCEQSEIPIPIDVWHGGTKKEMTKHTALALANAIRARGQA